MVIQTFNILTWMFCLLFLTTKVKVFLVLEICCFVGIIVMAIYELIDFIRVKRRLRKLALHFLMEEREKGDEDEGKSN